MSTSTKRISVTDPCVNVFELSGEVTAEDLNRIGTDMNESFDLYEKVSLMLIFRDFEGAKLSAAFDSSAARAQLRSLLKVEKYAVVGAPESLESLLETMDGLMPIQTQTFDTSELDQAWDFIGARPTNAS